MSYNTPGVYVEEKSTLPPSVAEVGTAIPAFLGYTRKHKDKDVVEVAQVSSLLEYRERFGEATATAFAVQVKDGVAVTGVATPSHMMWYAIDLYFKNGGGRCYVISVSPESEALAKAPFERGLAELTRYDEPTLVVMPEAVLLPEADYQDLCQQMLSHCERLRDRFAILDVQDGDIDKARAGFVGPLTYGAAYHPYLKTSLTHVFDEKSVAVSAGDTTGTLFDLQSANTALYNQIKRALAEQRVTLPPSAAVTGVFARVDRSRGVWKAPANEGLLSVIEPVKQITEDEQQLYNVDPTTGKSINAIRSFTGRGTLVWGARTLAGNDNEWRYVAVRRLFLMVEESAKKATHFAVFEPNDATTWLKVKGMLESYLYGLWEKGALQGSKPEQAYFVNVGQGKTMTQTDILEGRMIVEIGLAAVRPAEFIVLRFSHKLAEA